MLSRKAHKKAFLISQLKSAKPWTVDSAKCICRVAAVGIPENFKPHAIRMAAAIMLDRDLSIDEVMLLGGWTSSTIFNTFYNRRKISNAAEKLTEGIDIKG